MMIDNMAWRNFLLLVTLSCVMKLRAADLLLISLITSCTFAICYCGMRAVMDMVMVETETTHRRSLSLVGCDRGEV